MVLRIIIIMRLWPLALLSGWLASCDEQATLIADVALTHRYDAAIGQQKQVLQAKQVHLATNSDKTAPMLILTVQGVHNQPLQADTLKQRVHKLAHLVAASVAEPHKYGAMIVQVSKQGGVGEGVTDLPSIIYPLATLKQP